MQINNVMQTVITLTTLQAETGRKVRFVKTCTTFKNCTQKTTFNLN